MTKVLVANRGEIAVRVMRTLEEMGIGTVAVYTDPDRHSLHVQTAREAVAIGEPMAYLDGERVIDAARRTGCDAVHPGYGFLSENAPFARSCAAAGLTFIGPLPETIEALGDKVRSRDLAARAGVPLVPGTARDLADEQLVVEAARLGYPVLVKAAAGGGGKGMRVVRQASELIDALAGARHEAAKFFKDPSVYLEKLVENPRHIEIQILADHHDHVIHCLERECSIQRRYQKIVEESPSPAMTPALRESMGAAAVSLARAAGYRNAGTVEFLVDASGAFYFLEVNARLQVEHPVTEVVTGLDLVAWQVRIARGEPLTVRQGDVTARGHGIEVRLYAEDPSAGFMPSSGRLLRYQEPTGPGVRVDSGVQEGAEVSPHYDPMIAKLVVHGPDREAARRRLVRVLAEYRMLGVRTNLRLLAFVADHPEFASGATDTGFLTRHCLPPLPVDPGRLALVAALAGLALETGAGNSGTGAAGGSTETGRSKDSSPFTQLGNVWLG